VPGGLRIHEVYGNCNYYLLIDRIGALGSNKFYRFKPMDFKMLSVL
jgi:hypothetical protein